MSNIDIIIFADYWVCTVITAVGYGDYTAGTSLEYCYAMMLEFLGFLIFAILQIAILQIMNLKRGHQETLNDNDLRIMIWLQQLDNTPSFDKVRMPNELYHSIRDELEAAFIHDNNEILDEYPFFDQLTPTMQT